MEQHPLCVSMRTYNISPDGSGDGAESDFINRVLKRIMAELQFYDSGTITWEQTTRGVRAHVINPTFGGQGGINWQTPKELDPTVGVSINTLVYISPNNPLVTTGLVDLTLMALTKSRPGIWLCVQAVPAENGSNQYNVPQVPYPGNGGTVTGTPLTGDADGSTLFWMLISAMPYC